MRSKILEEFELSITPEDHARMRRKMDATLAYHRWLEEQGFEYGTPTSISLKTLNEHGFHPMGICWYIGEETFIFKNDKDSKHAYETLERDRRGKWIGKVVGWYYSKKSFEKELLDKDNTPNIYWL